MLLAQILEDEGQPVAHVVMNRVGHEYYAGIGQGFDACRDVDAVAVEVAVLDDHVPEIDADAQFYAVVRCDPAFRSGISCCTATAQRTASTTLANSSSRPSPVVFTMRP